MSPLHKLDEKLSYVQFRTAILLGIASLPFTAVINWTLAPTPADATVLFVVCIISGNIYQSRSVKGVYAGLVTGLVGGLPILFWQSWSTVVDWWGNPILVDAMGDSWLMIISSVGAGVVTYGIVTLVIAVIGMVGGFVGEWLTTRIERTPLFGSKA